MSDDLIIKGCEIVVDLNLNMEQVLNDCYGYLLFGVGDIFVWQFGVFYGCDVLLMWDCYIVIIVVCIVLGGQMKLQLKVNIVGVCKVGFSCEEIVEIILYIVLYGGMLVVVNVLNVVFEVFEEEDV